MKNAKILVIFLVFLFTLISLGYSQEVPKACQKRMINPIKDIDWGGIFPIRLGGVTLVDTNIKTRKSNVGSPICSCRTKSGWKFGIKAEFWEPTRIIETVDTPYCFPSLGIKLDADGPYGTSQEFTLGQKKGSHNYVSAQVHHILFPVWAVLDLFLDVPCLTEEGIEIDILWLSEVDPLHNNCLLALIVNPEALLFSNPITQFACIADASIVNSPGKRLLETTDHLFWCAGSWGGMYPFCGASQGIPSTLEGNALIAIKHLFKLSRTGLWWDKGENYCGRKLTPILVKSNYRLQLMRPTKGRVVPIGQSGMLWQAGKNPPHSKHDFAWVLFNRNLCCMYVW